VTSQSKIRNFGFIAHIDAGKTTTTERVLFVTGENHRIGEVDEGTTITDWMDEERERGITITSAAVSCHWNDHDFHIIDTPGHVDFTAEVQRSLRVLDGAVVIFCGVGGVQTQSETVWKQSDNYKIPRIVFVNKMDRLGANFDSVCTEIEEKLKVVPVPVVVPWFSGDNLVGIIDIITMQAVSFTDTATIASAEEIPDYMQKKASSYRENLIDILSSHDDTLLEAALSDSVTEEMIISVLRRGTLKRSFVPVLSGTSLKNTGIPLLLDAVCRYLPSPDDRTPPRGYIVKKDEWDTFPIEPESPPVAYCFKVQYNKEKGPMAFMRIYAGTIKQGDTLYNPRTRKKRASAGPVKDICR
jgi:elongation factor G